MHSAIRAPDQPVSRNPGRARAILDGEAFATGKRKVQTAAFMWQFSPEAAPSVTVAPFSDAASREQPDHSGFSRPNAKREIRSFVSPPGTVFAIVCSADSDLQNRAAWRALSTSGAVPASTG
jgi:hypothetical protein